jgi:hypothetical protein
MASAEGGRFQQRIMDIGSLSNLYFLNWGTQDFVVRVFDFNESYFEISMDDISGKTRIVIREAR